MDRLSDRAWRAARQGREFNPHLVHRSFSEGGSTALSNGTMAQVTYDKSRDVANPGRQMDVEK